jgi:hypothetical protein
MFWTRKIWQPCVLPCTCICSYFSKFSDVFYAIYVQVRYNYGDVWMSKLPNFKMLNFLKENVEFIWPPEVRSRYIGYYWIISHVYILKLNFDIVPFDTSGANPTIVSYNASAVNINLQHHERPSDFWKQLFFYILWENALASVLQPGANPTYNLKLRQRSKNKVRNE